MLLWGWRASLLLPQSPPFSIDCCCFFDFTRSRPPQIPVSAAAYLLRFEPFSPPAQLREKALRYRVLRPRCIASRLAAACAVAYSTRLSPPFLSLISPGSESAGPPTRLPSPASLQPCGQSMHLARRSPSPSPSYVIPTLATVPVGIGIPAMRPTIHPLLSPLVQPAHPLLRWSMPPRENDPVPACPGSRPSLPSQG